MSRAFLLLSKCWKFQIMTPMMWHGRSSFLGFVQLHFYLFIYLFIWNKIDKSMDCITLEFLISWDFELAFIHYINFFMMRRQHCSGNSVTHSGSKSSTLQLWNPNPGILPPAPLSSKGQNTTIQEDY